MSKSTEIIDSVLLQKEIFGDELFVSKDILRGMAQSKKVEAVIREPEVEYESSTLEIADEATIQPESGLDEIKDLEALYNASCECQKCILGKTRNKYVFGKGNPNATVMLIGEGPGAEEDLRGEPFVGKAGGLLTDILKAINFTREEVYIANIVKCRPPGNRTPVQEEVDSCLPYLHKQIELIQPKFILCLGGTAANSLLQKKESLGKMRLNVYKFKNINVMVTYHPAALLRNPGWKRDCWEDVKAFRKLYDEAQSAL